MKKDTYWLLVISMDLEIGIHGPFADYAQTLDAARAHRKTDPMMRDGLHWMKVDASGYPEAGDFAGFELLTDAT